MSTNTVNTTVELLGKPYTIRCPESEVASLQQAAKFLSEKMQEVRDSGKSINIERIAIITALNVSYQLLQKSNQSEGLVSKINNHLTQLQEKLDNALNKPLPMELIYTSD